MTRPPASKPSAPEPHGRPSPSSTNRSPASARSGAAGEQLAAAALTRAGYVIEARNLRTTFGEIDLLARRRRTWIAVEVKARADHPAPERFVDRDRIERLSRALLALAPTLRPAPRGLRIDVVAVRWCATGPELLHFPAFVHVAGRPHADGWWRRPLARWYGRPTSPCGIPLIPPPIA